MDWGQFENELRSAPITAVMAGALQFALVKGDEELVKWVWANGSASPMKLDAPNVTNRVRLTLIEKLYEAGLREFATEHQK